MKWETAKLAVKKKFNIMLIKKEKWQFSSFFIKYLYQQIKFYLFIKINYKQINILKK